MSPTPGKNPSKPNKSGGRAGSDQTKSRRREGREAALQLLYSSENLPELAESPEELEAFWNVRNATPDVRKLAESLWRGYLANRDAVDARIAGAAENFKLERLAAVDRNILRVAIVEMFHGDKVPPVVSLNEALEIAKRFGSEDSARFINGVLDRLMKTLDRKLR
jgi:transcription antitermination protein NusB